MNSLPTSDLKRFEYQLNNPNTSIKGETAITQNIQKLKKNIVLAFPSDSTGCGHIRCIFPMNYLNSIFGSEGDVLPFICPTFIYQHDVLFRTRSLFFQRTMNPEQYKHVMEYKNLKKKYNYKMIWDLDDFLWPTYKNLEGLPSYNLASSKIGKDLIDSADRIMNLMDVITVSTEFLEDYLINERNIKIPVTVIHNTVPKYFWYTQGKRKPIKNKIERPRVIYTGSPSHYCNLRRYKGDWDNAWYDWVIKSVKDNKIDFCVMGGLPWFFENIKNKIYVMNWVNSYKYHEPILKFKPDFYLSPLVQNGFNFSKSNLKFIEGSAIGAISIGTVFSNGSPSPYDSNVVKIQDTCTVEDIEQTISFYSEPENFNNVIQKQYEILENNGYWSESDKFINKLSSIL